MDCKDYRNNWKEYFESKPSEGQSNSSSYDSWLSHSDQCRACSDWELQQRLNIKNIDVSTYPCVHIAYYCNLLCDKHADAWECADVVIVRTEDGEYGIPVKDGGSSYYHIRFCPWCGTSLSLNTP